MRYFLARFALSACLSVVLLATASAASPQPMLWKATRGDSTVYLLGSMHFLMKDDYPLSSDVDAAYQHAHKLVFEIPPEQMNPILVAGLMLQHGRYPDASHTLKNDLSPALWTKLVAYGAKNGLPVERLQMLQPWAISLMLVALESQKIGMDPNLGLDMHFMKMAAADHKPTGGFETPDQQLAIFYSSPIKDQAAMLEQSLDQIGGFKKEMNGEHDMWRRGEGDVMAAQAKKEFAHHPELYNKLVTQRNRNWIPLLEKMLDGSKQDTLVIVGALHLAGPDGVVRLLRKDGYAVERICTGCATVH